MIMDTDTFLGFLGIFAALAALASIGLVRLINVAIYNFKFKTDIWMFFVFFIAMNVAVVWYTSGN